MCPSPALLWIFTLLSVFMLPFSFKGCRTCKITQHRSLIFLSVTVSLPTSIRAVWTIPKAQHTKGYNHPFTQYPNILYHCIFHLLSHAFWLQFKAGYISSCIHSLRVCDNWCASDFLFVGQSVRPAVHLTVCPCLLCLQLMAPPLILSVCVSLSTEERPRAATTASGFKFSVINTLSLSSPSLFIFHFHFSFPKARDYNFHLFRLSIYLRPSISPSTIVRLFVCVCLSVCLTFSLCMSVCMSTSSSISVCLPVYVCLSVFLYACFRVTCQSLTKAA